MPEQAPPAGTEPAALRVEASGPPDEGGKHGCWWMGRHVAIVPQCTCPDPDFFTRCKQGSRLLLLAAVCCRDIVDASPGVHWGDIAGLEDAKRVLHENVVLPLYLPAYFQGIRRPIKVAAACTAAPWPPHLPRWCCAAACRAVLPAAQQDALAACCSVLAQACVHAGAERPRTDGRCDLRARRGC